MRHQVIAKLSRENLWIRRLQIIQPHGQKHGTSKKEGTNNPFQSAQFANYLPFPLFPPLILSFMFPSSFGQPSPFPPPHPLLSPCSLFTPLLFRMCLSHDSLSLSSFMLHFSYLYININQLSYLFRFVVLSLAFEKDSAGVQTSSH